MALFERDHDTNNNNNHNNYNHDNNNHNNQNNHNNAPCLLTATCHSERELDKVVVPVGWMQLLTSLN